jgi:TonB family protein
MRVSQLLLNALLNACWQIVLISACASVCAWLLRSTAAHYRHALWVAALLLSIGLPLSTSAPLSDVLAQLQPAPEFNAEPVIVELRAKTDIVSEPLTSAASNPFITVNAKVARTILFVYLGLVGFAITRLMVAWRRTRRIIRDALPVAADARIDQIVEHCKAAIGVRMVEVLSSTSIPVPIAAGFRRPAIIIPTKLLTDSNDELLTSAIGHEVIHVRRRDYLLNLVYELIYLPLSFHPAAALIRRRISQTRELCCDELVADRLQSAHVYARSLVQLAAWAPPLRRLAKSTTVGIADADNLEARVMSLLKESKPKSRRKVVLLLATALVLALPVVAAASFALQFEIDPQSDQEPKLEAFVRPMPEYTADARAQKIEGTVGMLLTIDPNGAVKNVEVTKPLFPSLDKNAVATVRKWQFPPYIVDGNPVERQLNTTINFSLNTTQQGEKVTQQQQEIRETQERLEKLKREAAAQDAAGYGRSSGEGEASSDQESAAKAAQQDAERSYRRSLEIEAKAKAQAELVRHVRISMDQAIQIATSKYPGTVMEGTLVAERWESTGALAKDSDVWYHLRIFQKDDEETIVHVWISATDGHIVKTEKEKRRQAESGGGPDLKRVRGGVLNGRALHMPPPQYPAMARTAGAEGLVVVEVVVDEGGNVIEAHAVSGHPLLQSAAVSASREAKFAPTRLEGQPVSVRGTLTYNFVKN